MCQRDVAHLRPGTDTNNCEPLDSLSCDWTGHVVAYTGFTEVVMLYVDEMEW
jgi:hypothetical protein